jgi:hypothetical protein
MRRLLRDAGLRIRRTRGIPAPFPKAVGENWLGRGLLGVNRAMIRLSPELFSYQIFVEAETTPDVAFVLADSRTSEASGARARPYLAAAAKTGRRRPARPRKRR